MPKPGDKNYKGPVHEAVRNSPLGSLVRKRKTKRRNTYTAEQAKKDLATNRAQYAKDVAAAKAKGYVEVNGRLVSKSSSIYKDHMAKKAAASRAKAQKAMMRAKTAERSDPNKMAAARGTAVPKKTRTRSTAKKTVTRRSTVPKKTGSTSRTRQVGRVASKVAARSGLSKSAARAKARKIIKKRGR